MYRARYKCTLRLAYSELIFTLMSMKSRHTKIGLKQKAESRIQEMLQVNSV